MKTWKTWAGLLCLATTLWGCPTTPDDTGATDACGPSERFEIEGQQYCVVRQSIIEMGFNCPAELANQFPLVGGVACGDIGMIADELQRDLQGRLDDQIRTTACMPGDVYPEAQIPGQCTTDAECAAGESCVDDPDAGCISSACSCDGGQWACTADCGIPKTCKAASGPAMCAGQPDPSYQECTQDSDCGEGEGCVVSDEQACVASECFCDANGWGCTDDCGQKFVCAPQGGQAVCMGQPDPSYQVCQTDDDCPGADNKCLDSLNSTDCVPSSCGCNEGGWVCTEDCGTRKFCSTEVVEPDPTMCGGQPDPSVQECDTDNPCADGFQCVEAVTTECISSACECDEANGLWTCTADCGQPNRCIPAPATCEGQPDPSYNRCTTDADCFEGAECLPAATQVCVASSCSCEAGGWVCTEDCGMTMACVLKN